MSFVQPFFGNAFGPKQHQDPPAVGENGNNQQQMFGGIDQFVKVFRDIKSNGNPGNDRFNQITNAAQVKSRESKYVNVI